MVINFLHRTVKSSLSTQAHSSSPTWSSCSPVAFLCSSWRWPWVSTPAREASPAGEKSVPCSKVGWDSCMTCWQRKQHLGVMKSKQGLGLLCCALKCHLCRSWLWHPGDRDPAELLLHHCSCLGDLLPVFLLLLGPGLVILQQHLEHR